MDESRPTTDLLSGRTLFRLGLALVILSVTFLFRYSVQQGWLGPLARVGLAAVAGALMIGVGLSLSADRRVYANLLQGGGSAVLYLAAFAAHRQYGLADTTEAFIQLTAVASATLVLALRARSETLAGIGLVGAAAAPILVGGRLEMPGGDAAYLAVVGVIASVLLVRMEWLFSYVAAVTAITFVVSIEVVWDLLDGLVSLPTTPPSRLDVAAAIAVSWALLVAVPLLVAARRSDDDRISVALPAVTMSFGSPLAYAAAYAAFGDRSAAWAGVALAGSVFHALAGLALARRNHSVVARVQVIPTVILAILAMSTGLTGDWILVGMSAISAGAVIGGTRSRMRMLTDAGHAGMALTFVAAAITTAFAAGDARSIGEIAPVGLVLVVIALTGLAQLAEPEDTYDAEKVYLLAGFLGVLGWMLVEFPRLGDQGLAAVTAGWAALGLAAIAIGKLGDSRPILGLGFTTLALSIAKLFLVDLAEAAPITRIVLFAGIGVALLGVGYWLGDGVGSPRGEQTDQESYTTTST